MQSYGAGAVGVVRPRSVATRNGVVAGLVMGTLSLPDIALNAIGRTGGGALGIVFVLIALIVFALVGLLASRHDGLIRSGVWAGFLGALITTFIALCVGTVIVIALTPTTLLLAHAAHPGAHPAARAALSRVIVARALLGSLELLLAGLVGGLIGGALGRLTHPRNGGRGGGNASGPGPRGAPYVADPAAPTREYTAPPQPMSPPSPAQGYSATSYAGQYAGEYAGDYAQEYAAGYPPATPASTPPLYYPPATPSVDDTPTSRIDGQR